MTLPNAAPARRESDAELQALFAAMSDVILVLDAEGRYVKIAPTNAAPPYRPAPDLLGRTLHDVFPKAQADEFLGLIERADRKSTRLNSSHLVISYAVFCL